MRAHLRATSIAAYGLCTCAWVVSSLAAAQTEEASESVVLLAPSEVRAEWTAALQLELAARGAVAIPADAPEVATVLLGDAEAQRAALERGARAAVWVEARPDAWRLRMVSATAERARVVPVARDADARTVALILVSLLDGAAEPPVDEVATTASTTTSGPRAELASPAELFDSAEFERASSDGGPARSRRGEPYVHWSGFVGVSGIAIADDVSWELGGTLRAGIGLRYDWLEISVLHDLGFYMHVKQFAGPQPIGRLCLEAGAGTPRTTVAFHAGAHGCFGSLFAIESQGGFFSHGPRTHISGGGYAAASFALVDSIRLFIRADVDVAWTDFGLFDSIDVVPAVSALLSFG